MKKFLIALIFFLPLFVSAQVNLKNIAADTVYARKIRPLPGTSTVSILGSIIFNTEMGIAGTDTSVYKILYRNASTGRLYWKGGSTGGSDTSKLSKAGGEILRGTLTARDSIYLTKSTINSVLGTTGTKALKSYSTVDLSTLGLVDLTSTQTLTHKTIQPTRDTMNNHDHTFLSGANEVYLKTALTAARVLTLPAANYFPAGSELIFVDEIGGVTSDNTVTITRAGSDLIDGATTLVVNVTNSITRLITDGTSKWTANTNVPYATGTWIPTWTGFSVNPVVSARYTLVGKMCYMLFVTTSTGTSNASTATVTLPFQSKNDYYTFAICTNSGTNSMALVHFTANSNVMDAYKDLAAGAFTASGVKMIYVNMVYEIK